MGDHSPGSPPELKNYQQLTTSPANADDDGTPVDGDGFHDDELLDIHGSRTEEDHRGQEAEEEPGVFGQGGLLAVQHVKVILILACVTQVRNVFPVLHSFICRRHRGRIVLYVFCLVFVAMAHPN